MGCQVGQCEPFLQVLFHEVDGGRYDVVFVGLAAGGFAVLLQVTQRAQVIVESGAGIQQVFVAVTHFQRAEYLFKKIVAVADPGLHARLYLDRAGSLSCKIRSQLPFEMDPVDRPRICFVGTVSMGHAGREDEILVCRNRKFLIADAEPSGTFYAIDENELADRLQAFAEMMQRLWVIADVRNVKDR